MSIKKNIEDLRHVLYRLKVKLLYNSSIGKSLRESVWKIAGADDGVSTPHYERKRIFDNHGMNHIQDPRVIAKFQRENTAWSEQRDAIYQLDGDITIEPENSLAYLSGNRFFLPTRSNSHEYLVPNAAKDFIHRALRRDYTHYDALIHLDGFVGKNLYHFFDEAVNALLLLLKDGTTDLTIPLLINEKVYRAPYVQHVLALPDFKDLPVIIQRAGEWIKVKHLYKAMPSYALWPDCYQLMARHVIKKPHRRIFLNRKASFQRRLSNNEAIEAIVRAHNFEIVYAEDLTYAQQIQLFAETEYFVGLHGAGFTNLIYSDLAQVHILEIFSESLVHPHYYWYLELLKVKYYDAMMGSPLDVNWNYRLDEAQFSRQLDLMFSPAS